MKVWSFEGRETALYLTHIKNPTLKGIQQQMTNQPKRHGGARPGAGRPKSTPQLLPNMPATPDPLVFLLALVNEPAADMRLRLSAAVACLPYVHARMGESGTKDKADTAAKKAGAGKFAASRPPVRLVT